MNPLRCAFSLAASAISLLAFAGEPAPQPKKPEPPKVEEKAPATGPYRPYKELQDVLYYEGFENPSLIFKTATVVDKGSTDKDKLASGDVVEQDTLSPSGHAIKMPENTAMKNEKALYIQADLTQAPMKLVDKLNPNLVWIQFMLWCDEPGDLTIKFTYANGEYEDTAKIPKAKGWGAVTLRLGDLKNTQKVRPEPHHVLSSMGIILKPREKKRLPNAFIDDVVFTLNAKPADMLPKIAGIERRRLAMSKTAEKDGFVYSEAIHDKMRAAFVGAKPARKPKVILVAGPTQAATTELVTAVTNAQKAARDSTFTLKPMVDAAGAAVGGMDDARLFLQYNLDKFAPEAVLVVGGVADMKRDRPAESLRRILLRSVASGTIPVVCAPPIGFAEKAKTEEFVKAVDAVCAQLGAPWLDSNFVTKSMTAALYNGVNLTPQGTEKIGTQAYQVLKHVHEFTVE